jgi:hypothetical protein
VHQRASRCCGRFDALLFGTLPLSTAQRAHAAAQRATLPNAPEAPDAPSAAVSEEARAHSDTSSILTSHLIGSNWFCLMRDTMAQTISEAMPAALKRCATSD